MNPLLYVEANRLCNRLGRIWVRSETFSEREQRLRRVWVKALKRAMRRKVFTNHTQFVDV